MLILSIFEWNDHGCKGKKAKIAVPDGHCTLTCWNCLKDDNFFEVKKIFKVKKNYNVEIECANFHEATINSIT